MKKLELQTWSQLTNWLNDSRWQEQHDGKPRFAFRGQANSEWLLKTSLARHFLPHHVDPHQWRTRELKMCQMFRERLIRQSPGIYEDWESPDIVALMQHYGAPTRFIDFSYSPRVAAWFALKDALSESAIWVVDRVELDARRKKLGLPDYCGPILKPNYQEFDKGKDGQHLKVGAILDARPNDRLAAQHGCFFVPGSISKPVDLALVLEKVVLSERIAIESLSHPSELGFADSLFPNLDALADEARRFSVAGGEHYPMA